MQDTPASFADRLSPEELAHQFRAMAQIEGERRLLALVPFGISTLWLPLWLCLLLAAVNLAVESAGYALLRRVAEGKWRRAYWPAMAGFALGQITFMAIAAMVWQFPDPYAKAVAVGIYMVNLTHIATVRSVHLPLGFVCLVPATLIALSADAFHWVDEGETKGLALSILCVIAVTYFVWTTMRSVHQLHRDLAQDRRAAQGANDAKTRFLAQMSHELRTPLNAIMGLGHAEMAEAQSHESRDRLGTMVQSARSLSVLLDDILDFSAVEAGALPIRPAAVEMQAEIAATLALFRRQIAEAGLDLEVSYDASLPRHCRADGQRLRQCLSNVLTNAIKYGGPGRLRLTARLEAPALVMIDVIDEGAGVPAELREHIFEPFQRGAQALPGTGLGLAISRRLARRMGGDLVLLPSTTGAHFRLTFEVAPASAGEVPPAPDQPPADLRGLVVLVVDDVATNRLVASRHLELMGAETVLCDSGPAALIELAARHVDAVLLDMLMPGMDGIATLHAIRRLPGPAGHLPVLAMTADVTEDRRQACLSAGMDGYVTKPIEPEALSAALQKVLNRPCRAGRPRAPQPPLPADRA